MVDLYNNGPKYAKLREELPHWECPLENREAVHRYLENHIDHLSPGRRYTDLIYLRKLFLGQKSRTPHRPPLVAKPLSALTLDDFIKIRARLIKEIASKDTFCKIANHLRNLYEDEFAEDPSKRDIITALFRTGRRRFFQWVSDKMIIPTIDQNMYYTLDEFEQLLRATRRPQEKAILAVAWESTARPNEYLSLKVRDVEEMPDGFKIRSVSTNLRHFPFAFREQPPVWTPATSSS